jgi:hypothetical protein
LLSAVDELADDGAALSDEERTERLQHNAAEQLELERLEECVVELAEAVGQQIPRRPDSDPRAILHLASSLPAPIT